MVVESRLDDAPPVFGLIEPGDRHQEQMRAVGAEVELIPGTRQDTADAAVVQADSIFYASLNWQAHFLQGTKTLAYELWEDLGLAAPDHVIIPCGAGSSGSPSPRYTCK